MLLGAILFSITSFGFENGQPLDIKLNHKIHIEKEKLECDECHESVLEKDKAGWPSETICVDCHEEAEKNGEKEDCLYCHNTDLKGVKLIEKGQKKVTFMTKPYKQMIFSHKKHEVKNSDCNVCHGDIANKGKMTEQTDKYMPTSGECIECHQEKIENFVLNNSCETCHTKDSFSSTLKPNDHNLSWNRYHGGHALVNSDGLHGTDCLTCHTKIDCEDCHLSEAPVNHSIFWKTRGHGFNAAIDQDNCLICHKQEACISCHLETAPRNHIGNYQKNHCVTCHLDEQNSFEEGCGVCHRKPTHLGLSSILKSYKKNEAVNNSFGSFSQKKNDY